MNNSLALLVEDDRSWQQVLREILQDSGLEVHLAADKNQALALIKDDVFRIAVVDLSLVEADHLNQDGIEVVKHLYRINPYCATVLLTGYASVELAVYALTELGVLTCLRKEMFNRSEFRKLIEKALTTPINLENPSAGKIRISGEVEQFPLEMEQPGNRLAIVIEDDASWREIFVELLSDAGYTVQECRSFGEALGCLRRETYRLAVVDLSLNRTQVTVNASSVHDPIQWDGYRLLEKMQSLSLPVIVVSGVANAEDIELIYKDRGVFSVLEKQSFDRRTFLTTIFEADKSYLSRRLFEALSKRELEVLRLLSQGLTNKEIAEKLFITSNTVKRHLKSIFEKLNIHTRSSAVALSINWFGPKLVDPEHSID